MNHSSSTHPVIRSISATGFAGKSGHSYFTAWSSTNHLNLLIADGPHCQVIFPGPRGQLVRLSSGCGRLASDGETHSRSGYLREVNPDDFTAHLQVLSVLRGTVVAKRQNLES